MPTTQHKTKLGCPGCRERDALIEALRQQIDQLQRRVDALEREAHRQAAPFRRAQDKRKTTKGRPGRKPGHKGAYRQPPPQVDQHAEVELTSCPQCGGPVHDVRAVHQHIVDIPQVRVYHLHLTTHCGQCERCGCVRSTHPQQVSIAEGAAGTHLGRNALALAADLNKRLGLTMRKTCAVLSEHFGLNITPGGLSQALDRIAARLQVPFEQLGQALRYSAVVHADETGWWKGGLSAWLWVFTNSLATLYAIGNRSQEMVRQVLGDEYRGILVSDCLASYDPHPGRKSKCCAHHLKAIEEARALAPDSEFLRDIRAFFKAAIALHGMRKELDDSHYWQTVTHLQRNLDELLATSYGHAAELRILNRLRKHQPHLLTFLYEPDVDPTNNQAERQLRPAVIARKLSCGNKTDNGAATFEVLASLAATCRQRGRSFTELVASWLSLGLPPPPPLFAPD